MSYFILVTALCATCCVTIPISLRKPLGIGKFRKLRKVTFWFQAELGFEMSIWPEERWQRRYLHFYSTGWLPFNQGYK